MQTFRKGSEYSPSNGFKSPITINFDTLNFSFNYLDKIGSPIKKKAQN